MDADPDLAAYLRAVFSASYPKACWNCTGYAGPLSGGAYAECSKPRHSRVHATPDTGCSGYEQLPGVDVLAVPAVHALALAKLEFHRQQFHAGAQNRLS